MKEEIKEILDKLKTGYWYEELDLTGTKWIELRWEESHLLLDYITNLQEVNKLTAESTEWESKCYDLQEENERLNKTLEKVQQEYTDEYNLRHKLSFELSVEKDKILELSRHLTMYSSEEKMLKEIERLNNIINELEKYINKTKLEEFEKVYGKRYGKTFTQAEIVICNMILEKLKELKEGK